MVCTLNSLRGFVKLKKNPKNREILGSGWVGLSSPNSDFFFENCVFFYVFVLFSCFQNKLDSGVGGYGLTNPSFSRIFGFFLTWQDP